MPPPRPVVALLTDFGTRDPYVAAMKAVLVSRCEADLIDLGHEITAHDVFEGAMFLRFLVPSFATERPVVVVAIVDPGVGSGRRILAAAKGRLTLLAPDNGLVDPVIDASWEIRSVEEASLFLPERSSTFHGRDRFAPVAAALASGTPFARVGPRLDPDQIRKLGYEPPRKTDREIEGTVIGVDRFGNVITDVESAWLEEPRTWEAEAGGRTLAEWAATYAEREGSSEPFLIIGSRGTVEISVARGSAADLLHLGRFGRVRFRRTGNSDG